MGLLVDPMVTIGKQLVTFATNHQGDTVSLVRYTKAYKFVQGLYKLYNIFVMATKS